MCVHVQELGSEACIQQMLTQLRAAPVATPTPSSQGASSNKGAVIGGAVGGVVGGVAALAAIASLVVRRRRAQRGAAAASDDDDGFRGGKGLAQRKLNADIESGGVVNKGHPATAADKLAMAMHTLSTMDTNDISQAGRSQGHSIYDSFGG